MAEELEYNSYTDFTIRLTVSQPALNINESHIFTPTETMIISFGRWIKGEKGDKGDDGITPHIDSTTGNWFIGDVDTGVKAQGEDGQDGVTPHIDQVSGNWFIGDVDTGVHAQGEKGEKGDKGDDGVGIPQELSISGNNLSISDGNTVELPIQTVNNATLTIQKNSITVDTFTANASVDKTINITVPTTASDVNALPSSTKYCASLLLSINSSTYVITAQLKDQDGNNLDTAQTIDLPLESVVVSGSYDSTNKKIVLTLQNGNTIDISVGDLISGLQSEITAQNPLSADLLTDGTTNVAYTATEQSKLSGIEAGAEVNVQSDWNESDNTDPAYISNKPTIPSAINDLSDVDITSATNQNVLMYDSTSSKWKNATIPSGVTSLSALSDVALTSLANGQMLKYNSTSQKWENVDIPSDAFICTFTRTTDPQTDTEVYSCDKTISEIIAAANEGKTVIAKISESSEETEATVFIPLNLILDGIVIFGGLTATPYGNGLMILYGVHNSSTDSDEWNNESSVLGTASQLDVPSSGNASSSQVVKGDDTRLAAEVLWCSWDDTNNTVTGLTVQQIVDAKTNHKIVCCKDNNTIFICTHASNYIVFSCLHSGVSASSDSSSANGIINDFIVYSPSNQKWGKTSFNVQKALVSGTNIKTINGNNLLGSGDVHISGDIMFLTATAGSNNTYRLPKTVQELVDLYDNGITVVVNVSSLLYYRISRSSPLFINITNDYVIRILYTVGAGSDASDTVWRINTRTIQEKLVSGTNIKTINNESILGSGDISITASGINAIPSSEKGAASGVAELDANGKVPSSQLPSYVDDVLEYASQSAFPSTGESGKIYIALDTNQTYRWSGSAYIEISQSLALGETSSTAYAGNKGKANADAIAAIKDGTSIDSFGDVETALADKINKVSNPTNGNFAALDSNGNVVDSGHKHSDYLTSQENADWNATSGPAKILNKPTIPASVSGTNDGTNWTSLTIGSVTKNIPSGGGGGLTNYDFTPLSTPTISSNATTITFAANQRNCVELSTSTGSDLSIALISNNQSDNYIWITNSHGSADIDVIFSSIKFGTTTINDVKGTDSLPSIGHGETLEIGVYVTDSKARITSRIL